MSPPPIFTLPADVLTLVLASCDTPTELRAFISTCRRIHDAWITHAPPIIWAVFPNSFPCFDDALIVVRATAIVTTAEAQGTLPPLPGAFPLASLSGRMCLPSLAELSAVHDLGHLVVALHAAFCLAGTPACAQDVFETFSCFGNNGPVPPRVEPETIEHRSRWRERIHRTIYRLLLAGPVFSGAYNEPFFRTREPQVDEVVERVSGSGGGGGGGGGEGATVGLLSPTGATTGLGKSQFLSPAELEYIERFAVYNMSASLDAQEAVFGPFGSWLMDNFMARDDRQSWNDSFAHDTEPENKVGRSALCGHTGSEFEWPCIIGWASVPSCNEQEPSHAEAHLALLSVLRMIWVLGKMKSSVIRKYTPLDKSGFGTERGVSWYWTEVTQRPDELASVPVVLFGVFQAEKISVPRKITLKQMPKLVATPLGYQMPATEEAADNQEHQKDMRFHAPFIHNAGVHIHQALEWIQSESGRPNSYDPATPTSPMLFGFFEFLLRKYFALRFRESIFTEPIFDQEFEKFMGCFDLFALEEIPDRYFHPTDGNYEIHLLEPYDPQPFRTFRKGHIAHW